MTPAYCLSIHARYHCEHSGVCCTAGWPIPLERVKLSALRTLGFLTTDTRVAPDARHGDAYRVVPRTADGACAFYDADHDRLCAIHRDAGAEMMPTACRNFPRVALRDPRGVFVTLSHFCPTAARLLLSIGPIEIVDAPPAMTLDGEVEGLDATAVMPPLLREGMLMDWDGYSAWEHEGVDVLNDPEYSARVALAIVTDATHDAAAWCPGGDTLSARMSAAFDRARSARAQLAAERLAETTLQRALKRFLASHLFANWAAYQGVGLRAVLAHLEQALLLVGEDHNDEASFIAAVRSADLRLRHSCEASVKVGGT